MEPPPLTLEKGRSILVTHPEPKILTTLARVSAAKTIEGDLDDEARLLAGEVRWDGRTLDERARSGEKLGLFRTIALVEAGCRLLSGKSVLDCFCLDLEYNQGLFRLEARRAAMETLERLGLSDLADSPQESLPGPERGLALVALALSRRPALLILDRPGAFLDEEGLSLAWREISGDLAGQGRAALVLDYSSETWTGDMGISSVLSL
ncbi:MAG: hypothetical protein LBE49_05570 [Deltaproteobacteria bacterium]|nr:hypothetical protein [Deltaproteobacteria bacterium]